MARGAPFGRGGGWDGSRGAVLILVLWFLATAAVLAGVMASEARLTATAAHHNRLGVQRWADTLQALRVAEMELMLARMPEPLTDQGPLSEQRDPNHRFDGRPLATAYPLPENVEVSIWDHAGRINLNNISRQRMGELLRARVADDDAVEALLDAWQDWLDNDDLKRLNGAEEEYYSELDPPYKPRNARLESVDELLLIKGFKEALEGVDLNAVFTIYGGNTGINPNLASREALALLPGMSEEALVKLLDARAERDLKSRVDITELVDDATSLQQLLPWLQFSVGNFYTIAVSQVPEEPLPPGAPRFGYQQLVQARGFQQPPMVLLVRPYGRLPEAVGAAVAAE